MSEEGWRAFLAADGVEDWAVLHGGPVAAFRTGSLAESAKLAAAVAEVQRLAAPNVALTATTRWLTVRLTRELWGIEERHIGIAREISAVARQHGATADRSAVQEVQFAVAAKPESIDVGFWRAVLGYDTMAPDNGIDPLGHSSTVWMQDIEPEKTLRHAMHIDVSVPREQAQARLEAALAAGGRIVHTQDYPGGWILTDKSGNRVCIASWPDRGEGA
ncbi:MAG TPA: VOC family protein [Candidatus Limnocylindrales bacterium]